MLSMLTRESMHVPLGVRNGRGQRVLRQLGDAVRTALGPAQAFAQRQDVVRRAIVAAVIIAALPIQQMRIPGWPAVMLACVAAIVYDVLLAYLVFVKQRYSATQILGLVLDALVLMGASLYVFHEMSAAGSDSDIWLVFLVYIVIGGFTLAPIGSLLYTALWTGWFALGTLLYFPTNSHFYDQLPIRLIFFALIGFVALSMARELQKRRVRLEQQNRQTMGMLATLVEARDTDAGAHLHHIQHFSRALALHLGLTGREAQELANASMMHDVGKANVPDAVLKKTGPLSPDEWRMMQRHTIWGESLLAENQDFEMARLVARWHHEHWDGSGYPDGLEGEQIPLAARIVAVADVFDALISERPYKKAWPPEAALQEIKQIAGSHLDPQLVEAFVELWEQGVITEIIEQITNGGASQDPPIAQAA